MLQRAAIMSERISSSFCVWYLFNGKHAVRLQARRTFTSIRAPMNPVPLEATRDRAALRRTQPSVQVVANRPEGDAIAVDAHVRPHLLVDGLAVRPHVARLAEAAAAVRALV